MPDSGFLWTLPCYILARNYTTDPSGDVVFDENIRFITPEMTSGGERGIAVFSDYDLAEQYRDETDPRFNLDLLDFPTPHRLKTFLLRALDQNRYRYVVVDLNLATRIGRNFLIRDLILELDPWINHLDDQGRQ